MSNFKRLVSSFLVLSVIATSGVFALGVFAENETAQESTKVELSAEDITIAEKLKTFGIIDAVDESELVSNISRGTAVDVLARYLGMGNLSFDSASSPFSDVSAEDERFGAYVALYMSGYISGDENGMFHPERDLTYNEAITLVINAMGYKFFAARNGGYPEGYLYTANKYELLGGLRGNGNNPIPYCDLYLLLERSLEANAVAVRGLTGDDNLVYTLQEGYTVLEELFGIKEIEGIVTGTKNTKLLSFDSSIDADQIEIDGVVYDAPGRDYTTFIGLSVKAYGKKTADGTYDVVYLEASERLNKKYQISAEDIVLPKTTFSRIYYTDADHKERHLDLVGNSLSVIYNEKSHSLYDKLNFRNEMPDSGYIVGLDNNNDKTIDVLFIYEFENYVIGAADFFDYKFYDKYDGREVELNPYEDTILIYDENREQITPEDIAAEDVLSVMETKNSTGEKIKTVYITKEEVNGTIEEMRGTDRYVINGKEYKLAQNAINYGTLLPLIGLGKTGTFYLDMEGKISHFAISNNTSLTYGVVVGVHPEDGNIKNSITLRIFTQSGVWFEADLTDNVNIDGNRYKLSSDTEFTQVVNILNDDNLCLGNVVLYETKDSKISYIDTIARKEEHTSDVEDMGNLTEIASAAPGENAFFQRNGFCFDRRDMSVNKFVAKSGACVIFITPARNEVSNEEKYAVVTSIPKNDYLGTASATLKDYQQVLTDGYVAYNLGSKDINVATCVILRGATIGTMMGGKTDVGVFIKATTAVDTDGMSRTKLYYAVNSVEKTEMLAERIYYTTARPGTAEGTETTWADIGLVPGDLIQVGTDEEGYVNFINVVYRQSQTNDAWIYPGRIVEINDTGEDEIGGVCAKVVAYDPETQVIKIRIENVLNGETSDPLLDEAGNPIPYYEYNISTRQANISMCIPLPDGTIKVERAGTGDFIPGDTVILTIEEYQKTARQIVIIKD